MSTMAFIGVSIAVVTAISTYVIHHMVEDRDNGGLAQFIIFIIGLSGSVTHAASLYLH